MTIDYLNRYTADDNGCWNYTGTISRKGYGQIRQTSAHRFFYQALVGMVPEGLQLDHLCLNKRCVNPEHLEPVAGEENMQRHADRHWIGRCRRCRAPKPGASLIVRERGNPHYECQPCIEKAAKLREEMGQLFAEIDLLAYWRGVAEAVTARKAAS